MAVALPTIYKHFVRYGFRYLYCTCHLYVNIEAHSLCGVCVQNGGKNMKLGFWNFHSLLICGM